MSEAMVLMLISIAGAAPFAYITNSGSNTVSVIDTATNEVVTNVSVGDYPDGVAVTPDGTRVYVANEFGKTVSVIDTATNTIAATVNIDHPGGVAVTPDGSKVYVANFNSSNVSVINTTNNSVETTVPVLLPTPTGIAITPDGKKVYVAHQFGGISVIDTTTNTVTGIDTEGTGGLTGLAVTPDGKNLYVAAGFTGVIDVINTTSNNVTILEGFFWDPFGLAVTPDGTKVYVTEIGRNNVAVIDTDTNKVVTNVTVGVQPKGVAVTPDGTRIYVANNDNNTVSVIDTATNTVTATVNVGDQPVAFGLFIGPGNPALNITKSATTNNPSDPTKYNSPGQTITYTYNVTNTGNTYITELITVRDNKIPGGQITIGTIGDVLAPGKSVPGTATYVVTQQDVDNGSVTNLANATGSYNEQSVLSNNTSVTVPAIQNPALKTEKEVDPKTYFAVGDLIDYSYTVTNKGNVDIAGPITVKDSMLGSAKISSSGLAPGQSITKGNSYLITPYDIDTGFVINSAFATGSFNNQKVTSNSDTAKAKFFGPTMNLYSS